jgi:hypothetical protein
LKIVEKGYDFIEEVGSGAFASVWKIKFKDEIFAVKIIDK